LDVTYQLRYYPPLGDVQGTAVIDGATYDTVLRASQVNVVIGNMGDKLGVTTGGAVTWKAYDGLLGEIWEAPNGSSAEAGTTGQYNGTYQNNSYQQDMHISIPIGGFNLGAPGIRCIWISTNGGRFQTQFTNQSGGGTIPKTTAYTMAAMWRLKWAGWYLTGDWDYAANHDVTTPSDGQFNLNVAKTQLRINWEDKSTDDQQVALRIPTGAIFRIVDTTDAGKWVEYTASSGYTEAADYTYWPVSQTAIQNSGPTSLNKCTIVVVNQQNP
jgi:hypothetical protein